MNLDLADIPREMEEGIYACWVRYDLRATSDEETKPHEARSPTLAAVLHYGPRPVFKDVPACEVHVLDVAPTDVPKTLTVTLVSYIRAIRDFPSVEALKEEIARDIAATRAILGIS
jgi:riboflavin kinase/FMN adenylyltransferase